MKLPKFSLRPHLYPHPLLLVLGLIHLDRMILSACELRNARHAKMPQVLLPLNLRLLRLAQPR